ncbi:VRR-NUC domain-containing protein [Spirosoma spitsbergense]|uniref:VRR-NUC domain-containing protein n=1 Tax=Spirosoma spitsbergense TaxID=431554 RepID=UPI0003811E67|nr:VRR-NUC domain-containing protein [Spirosoma spitsbergense]
MSEALSIEQYNALQASLPAAAKIKTRLVKKPKPDMLTAEQFRAGHVDQQESNLQSRCVQWFRLQYPQLLLFAVPNGGLRAKIEAAIQIGEGVMEGVPDLVLAYPTRGKPGLFIEMKCQRKGSKPTDAQLTVHAYLRSVGYDVAIPATFEQFQQAVINYLNQS